MLNKNYSWVLMGFIAILLTLMMITWVFSPTAREPVADLMDSSEYRQQTTLKPTIDPDALSAIEQSVSQISQLLPQIKNTIAADQASNERRIVAMEQQLSQLQQAVAQNSIDQAGVKSDAQPEQPFSLKRDEVLALELAQAQVAAFDHALALEVRDENWAAQMEELITVVAENELYQDSAISSANCKSTFCRLEAIHQGGESRDDFELIRREIPNSYHMQNFDMGDGSSKTVMYVIRQGEEMNNLIFKTLNEVGQ